MSNSRSTLLCSRSSLPTRGTQLFRAPDSMAHGLRSSSCDVLLDRAQSNYKFTATIGQSVPLDSVQEFRW